MISLEIITDFINDGHGAGSEKQRQCGINALKNAIPVMASRGRLQIDVHEKMNLLLYLFINLNLT